LTAAAEWSSQEAVYIATGAHTFTSHAISGVGD